MDDRDLAIVLWWDEAHDGPGWYYYSAEYPDEGSCGAFSTRAEAVAHAEDGGHWIENELESTDA